MDITNEEITPTKDDDPNRLYTTSNQLPSPFKSFFILPKPKGNDVKKLQRKQIMPSVISGEKGKAYFSRKEEERAKQEREKRERKQKKDETKVLKERQKENRKRELEEKKQIRLQQIAERQKNKRKRSNITSDESSDSSIDVTVESEGEGDDWDRPVSEYSDDKEMLVDDKRKENLEEKDFLEKEDYVIIIYEHKYYPGQIKNINTRNKTYLVTTMIQSGFNFRWPEKEDALWYLPEQIIAKIKKPKAVNSRGSYHVPEMCIYM